MHVEHLKRLELLMSRVSHNWNKLTAVHARNLCRKSRTPHIPQGQRNGVMCCGRVHCSFRKVTATTCCARRIQGVNTSKRCYSGYSGTWVLLCTRMAWLSHVANISSDLSRCNGVKYLGGPERDHACQASCGTLFPPWLVVLVLRSCQSPTWIWLVNYLHLHLLSYRAVWRSPCPRQ